MDQDKRLGLLLVIGGLGWNLSIGLLALALVVLTLPILLFPEKRLLPQHIEQAEPAGPGLLWRHYQGLLAQPGMLAWLAVVLTFKLGDSLGSPMLKPMLVDQGWSTAALGQLTLISSLAGIGGALLGGLLYAVARVVERGHLRVDRGREGRGPAGVDDVQRDLPARLIRQ